MQHANVERDTERVEQAHKQDQEEKEIILKDLKNDIFTRDL